MVSRPTIQDILETFHLRMILEVEAIGLAVDKITNDEIELLVRNNQEEQDIITDAADNQTKERAHQLNREFHMIIAQSSGNSRLAEYVQRLIEDMERMLAVDPYLAEPSQHLDILDSLKQRNKTKAQAAMRQHLEETRVQILNRF